MIHLTGHGAAIDRLARLLGERSVAHDLVAGVLTVPVQGLNAVIEAGALVLAPLEAGLVRVVNADLGSMSPEELLARTASAPTLENLIARRRNHRMLEAITAHEGVTVGFQPVVDLVARRTIGYEALLRVRAGGQDISPAEVLAAAEDAGRLAEIDAVARSVAVEQAAPDLADRLLSLNVLPASLPSPREQLTPLAEEVRAHGLVPAQIVLEAPVGPAGKLRRQLETVFEVARELGFLVGLDNVRSDRDLDAIGVRGDLVKVDRSVVRGLPGSSSTRTLGNLVRDCAHAGSTLIVQGVETDDQVHAVRELGVHFAQGWALGRPGAIVPEGAAAGV